MNKKWIYVFVIAALSTSQLILPCTVKAQSSHEESESLGVWGWVKSKFSLVFRSNPNDRSKGVGLKHKF